MIELVEYAFADEEPDPLFPRIAAAATWWADEFWRASAGLTFDTELSYTTIRGATAWPGPDTGPHDDAYRALINADRDAWRALGAVGRGSIRVVIAPFASRPEANPQVRGFAAPWWIVGRDDNYRRWYEPSDGGQASIVGGYYWTRTREMIDGGTGGIVSPLLALAKAMAHELGHVAGVAHHNNGNSPGAFRGVDCDAALWLMCANALGRQYVDTLVLPATASLAADASWMADGTARTGDWPASPFDLAFGRAVPELDGAQVRAIDLREPATEPGESETPMAGVLTINRAPWSAFEGSEVEIGDRIVVDFEPVGGGEQCVVMHDGHVIGGKGITHDSEQKLIIAEGPGEHVIRMVVIRGSTVEPDKAVTYTVAAGDPLPEPGAGAEPTIDGDDWSDAEGRVVMGAITLDWPGVTIGQRVGFTAYQGNTTPLSLGVIDGASGPDAIRWNTDTDDMPDGPTTIRAVLVDSSVTPPYVLSPAPELHLTIQNAGAPPPEPTPTPGAGQRFRLAGEVTLEPLD